MGLEKVVIYPAAGESEITVEGVDFLSLVNHETFGKPPIISDEGRSGVSVLYVNTKNVVAVVAERTED